MVKDIVEVHAYLQFRGFTESEELTKSHIDTPRAWANKHISFCDVRIIESVRTRCGHSERVRVEEPITGYTRIWISNHTRTKCWTTEIADGVYKGAGDITRKY